MDAPRRNLIPRAGAGMVLIAMGTVLVGACAMPITPRQHSTQEEANKQTVVAFYEAGLNRKDFDAASQYFGPYYRQHNPNAADGIEGFRKFIAYLKEKTPNSRSVIKRVFADGDYVILHVHKTIGAEDRGTAIVDIFRLENGKIVEHWDVSQAVPDNSANSNTMF